MSDLNPIFDSLLHLSGVELDKVITRARALRASSVRDPLSGKDETEHLWLLEGIRAELRRRGLLSNLPFAVIAKMAPYNKFAEAAPATAEWLESLIPNITRTEKLALSVIAARALADHIKAYRPVGLASLLQTYVQVPEAFERSYPGYARRGQECILVRR